MLKTAKQDRPAKRRGNALNALRKEILGNIQSLYGSNFIYSISFSNKVFS